MGRLDQQREDVLRGYAAAATADLIAAYDSLSSADIYVHVRDLFPIGTARVADIGAGTGRDAAWFAGSGHDVVAVEPVRELREAGQALHTASNIQWLDDRLPDLASLSAHRVVRPRDGLRCVATSQRRKPGDRDAKACGDCGSRRHSGYVASERSWRYRSQGFPRVA